MKNIHLLPTNKPSRLHYSKVESGEGITYKLILNQESSKCNDGLLSGQRNIYITSSEEISGFENNIWVIKGDRIFLWQNTMALRSDNKPNKIILTSDPKLIADGVQAIDDKFLQWFVKNPRCEEVKVETYFKRIGVETDANGYREMDVLGEYYKIIIPNKEPKTFKELFDNTGIEPTTDESGNIQYNFKANMKEHPKQENCCTPIGQIKRYHNCYGCDRKPTDRLFWGGVDFSNPNAEKISSASTITKEEHPKVETVEEAAEKYFLELLEAKTIQAHEKTWIKSMFIHIAKWQKEKSQSIVPSDAYNIEVFAIKPDEQGNLFAYIGYKITNGDFYFNVVPFTEPQQQRMYSEEEVIEILKDFRGNILPNVYTVDWFEQFKKK